MVYFTHENISKALKIERMAKDAKLSEGLELLQKFDVTGHKMVSFSELMDKYPNYPVTAFYAEGEFYFNNAYHVMTVMKRTYDTLHAAIDFDATKVKLDFRTVTEKFVFMVPDTPVLDINSYEGDDEEFFDEEESDEDVENQEEVSDVGIENALRASSDVELDEDADIDEDEFFSIKVGDTTFECAYDSYVRLFKAMEDIFWELNPSGEMLNEIYAVKARAITLQL